jgi:hypothetical protein
MNLSDQAIKVAYRLQSVSAFEFGFDPLRWVSFNVESKRKKSTAKTQARSILTRLVLFPSPPTRLILRNQKSHGIY